MAMRLCFRIFTSCGPSGQDLFRWCQPLRRWGWLEILAEETTPVGFYRIRSGSPVPVLDHIGAGRKMTECLKAKLAGIGRPLGKALRLRLDEEIILTGTHRPRQISPESDLGAGEVILRGVIDIDACHVERACRREVIDR